MAFDTEGRCHHRNCSSMRCAEQVKVRDSQSICELQHALGSSSHGAVHSLRCDGQACAQIVDGVKGGMRSESRDRESPRERIAHQTMDEDEWPPRSRLKVAQ